MDGSQDGKDLGNECKVYCILNYDCFEIKRVIWIPCLELLLANGGILCGIIKIRSVYSSHLIKTDSKKFAYHVHFAIEILHICVQSSTWPHLL